MQSAHEKLGVTGPVKRELERRKRILEGQYQDFGKKYQGDLKQLKKTEFFQSIQSTPHRKEFLKKLEEKGTAEAWIGGGNCVVLVFHAQKVGDVYEYIVNEVKKPAAELPNVIGIQDLIEMETIIKKVQDRTDEQFFRYIRKKTFDLEKLKKEGKASKNKEVRGK
jgi:hypothetical protein